MTDLRLKGLGTIANTLGVKTLFSMIGEEERRELFNMTADYFVNSNIYDQERQMELAVNTQRLRSLFGDSKLIKETFDFAYQILYK